MSERPPSTAESYLLDRFRRGSRTRASLLMLKGAIFLGVPMTFGIGLIFAAITDTKPDFLMAAAICIPGSALLVWVIWWVIGRFLKTQDPRNPPTKNSL